MRKRNETYVVVALALGLSLLDAAQALAFENTSMSKVLATQQKGSQERKLVGTVVDGSSGEPMIGVTIKVKNGKGVGTVTDIDGNFSINVTNKTELVVSYLGYKEQVVNVGDLGVITVKMMPDDQQLDEVVVVGAGTAKKVSITGSIATIKGDLLKTPSSSLTNGLAGKLAGVISTVSSGQPGSSSAFYIRGINTFGGVATPLILLDGVEISSSDLNNIPAESIESFSVLKDASATAIYGNRGANGVMLVTTKSGTENSHTSINVTFDASYCSPMNKIEFADGATYMRTYNEAQAARSDGAVTPRYTQQQIENTANHVNPYAYPDVDWYDLLFKSGNFNERANVNIQGGGSRVTYYMSLQANHDTGLFDAPKNYYYNSNYNRWEYNFQNNISYKLTNTTTAELRMMAQIGNHKGPNFSSDALYWQVMMTNPVAFPAYYPAQDGDGQMIRFGNAEIKSGTLGVNPYQYMLSSFSETNYNTLNTSLNIHQKLDFITKGLSAHLLVNFKNWATASYSRSISPYFYKMKAGSFNEETGEYETEILQTGTDYISQSGVGKSTDQTFYLDGRLDWKRSFGQHNATAMLMYMMREYRSDVLPNRNQGISGRLTYDYANRYLFEFNFGYNGSERLAKGDRFEFFPAVSLGWVISSEKFWKPLEKYVNFLKLRGSYGLVGSDQFTSSAPHFLYQNNIGLGSSYSFWTGIPGVNEISRQGPGFQTLAISNAGWEHVKKLDIGFDMKLFDQVNVTFDYFHDVRDRILMARASWPKMLGYWGSNPWSNIGKVTNHGVELAVTWNKRINKDLNFDVRANLTYNTNRYDYVDEPNYPYVWQTTTGKPLSRLTGYVAEGLFESQEEIDNWPDQSQLGTSKVRPGDIKYRDINGDGKITSEDQVMLTEDGWTPHLQYGIGFNMQWKKWDFGVFFNGSGKRKIMINSGYSPFLAGGGDGTGGETLPRNLMQWIADDHWSVDNPNPNASYPRMGLTDADIANNVQPSSYWVRNASFIRFKTLELGYSFKYCRVYFNGDNIAVFSPFKLWDPELSWNSYPLQRTFNLGVQIRL